MINLAEQLTTMICIKYINQKKTELNNIYKNYVSDIKIIIQQNN